MAITSLRSTRKPVCQLLEYAINPEKTIINYDEYEREYISFPNDNIKTERCMMVTGINCSVEDAAYEYLMTKKMRNKTGGVTAYHGIQSFSEKYLDAEIVHEIGVKLCNRLWGDKFEIIVATHSNTNNLHNHFVINSVSIMDGSKFEKYYRTYYTMRRESDKICREYGLSVIENPGRTKINYREHMDEKAGKITVGEAMRFAIDLAISGADSFNTFQKRMELMGFEFDLENVRPKLRHIGTKHFRNFETLGKKYMIDNISKRIENKERKSFCISYRDNSSSFFRKHPSIKNMSLNVLYKTYISALDICKYNPNDNFSIFLSLRDEERNYEKYIADLRVIEKYDICEKSDVSAVKENISREIDKFKLSRKECNKKLRSAIRKNDAEKENDERENLQIIGRNIYFLRKDMANCERIETMCEDIRQRLLSTNECSKNINISAVFAGNRQKIGIER